MMLEFNGKKLTTLESRIDLLKYWIEERENVRLKKEATVIKPWSADPIFQTTYFCNVRRENDKVTKFIRESYPYKEWMENFEFNIALSRFINWPDTLEVIGYWDSKDFSELQMILESKPGKVFGNAYIVSTCGRQMPKAQYICEILLPAVYERLGAASGWRAAYGSGPLAGAFRGLINVFGISNFMAGQIIADLKNTEGHPLKKAEDWWSWCVPGPGSMRGLSWLENSHPHMKYSVPYFQEKIKMLRLDILDNICSQDLQNCLCEFDKYCRVLTGIGKSKRKYNGN